MHFVLQVTPLIYLSENQILYRNDTDSDYRYIRKPKGGVGKTTLCVTFANYLVTKGVRVVVIDCDFQHSIMKCRNADLQKYGEQQMPYEVWAYEANDKEMMTSLMEKLHNDPEIDVVLMDSPGSLKAEGLVPMFVNTDIIVVPFHYDVVTVPSTASFLMFVDRLRKAVGDRMKAQLFIIPNLNDGRVGKRSELIIWDNTRDAFSNYGYVPPKIPKRADMERFSTMAALDMQAAIYVRMFNTVNPIREVELSGIQLTENIVPKPEKKKKSSPPEESVQATNEPTDSTDKDNTHNPQTSDDNDE